MGGSGYWRTGGGDDETGATPARQGGRHDATGEPERADQPDEIGSAAGDKPKRAYGENVENLSVEELLSAFDPEWDSDDSPGQVEQVDRADRPRPHHYERLPDETSGAIERFEPRQANLPELSREDGVYYVLLGREQRPWLRPAERAPADVQRIIAALDQGGGHAAERHEGYATEGILERRVSRLQDPAQLDHELSARGRDARKPDKLHPCEDTATAINNPVAFAAAFARGTEHPYVKAVFDRPREPYENPPPDKVEIPIDELLGEDGYRHCAGYRLLPIDGDMKAAKDYREAWAKASPEDRQHMMRPQTEPIPAEDFQGGRIVFGFRATHDYCHWEVATMFPRPRDRNGQQS